MTTQSTATSRATTGARPLRGEGHWRYTLQVYVEKVQKDNIRFLTAGVAWSILVSVIPISLALLAVTYLFFHGTAQQQAIDHHISQALQGVLGSGYLERLLGLTVRHSLIFGIGAVIGMLWAAEQVGFGISYAFDAMFEVRPRPFIKEKLTHLAMLVVFVGLMFLIVGATVEGHRLDRLILHTSLPSGLRFVVTTGISLACGFLLFATMYLVYPNTRTKLKLENVWRGALLAAALFQILTFIWPLYVEHLRRYGGVLVPLVMLTIWIYSFSSIMVIGGEVVAISALEQAEDEGEQVGPAPDGSVPEHATLRKQNPAG